MTDMEKHKRVNDIFLGPLERPALLWLAAHMPARVTPDILTFIGIIGAVLTFLGYWLTTLTPNYLWLASFGFVVNWFGDSLDGTLARYRKIERPRYGYFVDHVVDTFNVALIFLGLGLSPYVRFDLACLALVGYLMLACLVFLRTSVKGEFVISYAGFGPTEFRVLAIVVNILIFFIGNPQFTVAGLFLSVYDGLLILVTVILVGIFVVSAINQARELSRLEPN